MSGTINAGGQIYANGTLDDVTLQIGTADPNAIQPLTLRNETLGANTAIAVGTRATFPLSLPPEYGQINAQGIDQFAGHIVLGGLSAGVLGAGGGFATFPQTLNLHIGGVFVNTGTIAVQDYGTLNVSGGGALVNNGDIQVFNSALFATPLAGNGTIDVLQTAFSPQGTVDIAGPVGPSETIRVQSSHLQIDNPLQFLGQIEDNGNPIALSHVHASAALFAETSPSSGVLFLTDGGHPVAALRFSDISAGTQFGAVNEANGSAVVLALASGQPAPSGFIPAHVFMV